MKPLLAPGADYIWNMRLARKKPAGMVFITCIGELPIADIQVLAPRGNPADYDWRWCFDLPVCVVYGEHVQPKYLSELCAAVVRCAPNGGYVTPATRTSGYLWTWDASKQTGYQLTWWAGYEGIPEIGIPDQPSEMEVRPMSRFDRMSFDGIGA